MKKLEPIQQNKLISTYGGVGSIIETNSNGSLIILSYDSWSCFNNNRINLHEIIDKRLLKYIQSRGCYRDVRSLVSIPDNKPYSVYAPRTTDLGYTIESKYFPEWFYCSKCRKLKKYDTWKQEWNDRFNKQGNQQGDFDKNVPSCPYCSTENNGRFSRKHLTQVRFVMASLENGDIKDVPFDELWNTKPENGVWQTDRKNRPNDLEYRTLPNSDGLHSIYIRREKTNDTILLSKIKQNYIVKNNKAYKMEVRGSTSLYFPEIVSSIFIPIQDEELENLNFSTPIDMNIHEFRYLLANDRIVEDNLIVKRSELTGIPFVNRISVVERLKETSVLLSYTRMGVQGEPCNWYKDCEIIEIKPYNKIPFENHNNITKMPAVESYGEGLFFEIDISNIRDENQEKFIHTYCHIIMKEMEFQCGYPLTSLKEKIYLDKDNRKGGFLIYTIAGSEGSYGGLISLIRNEKIRELINQGAERAKHCVNDPICINDQHHCFACLDLPETSCVKFNKDLDRQVFLNYWSKS